MLVNISKRNTKWMDKVMVPVHEKNGKGEIVIKQVSVRDTIVFLNQQTARVNDLTGMTLELLGQLYLDRPRNEFFTSKLCGEINLKAAKEQAKEIRARRAEEKGKLLTLKKGDKRGRR